MGIRDKEVGELQIERFRLFKQKPNLGRLLVSAFSKQNDKNNPENPGNNSRASE